MFEDSRSNVVLLDPNFVPLLLSLKLRFLGSAEALVHSVSVSLLWTRS